MAYNKSHPLYGKRVFFIGRLRACSRRDVVAKLDLLGAEYREQLNNTTDIVVIGDNMGEVNSKPPSALEKAQLMQETGSLKIIDESSFFGLL